MSTGKNVRDRVWLTARARMLSEKRAIFNNYLLNFLVAYYTVFLIIFSIFSNYYKEMFPYYDQLSISASVVILVASLISTGFHFESRAAAHRICYLQLQKLSDSSVDDEEMLKQYGSVLDQYENHSSSDYYDMVIRTRIFEGKRLTSDGKEIEVGKILYFFYAVRVIFIALMVAVFTFIPLYIISLVILRSGH